jgi:hypothetical protein
LSASGSDSTDSDHSDVEHLLARLEEMVSMCERLVDTLASEATSLSDGPLPDPFYSSTFD